MVLTLEVPRRLVAVFFWGNVVLVTAVIVCLPSIYAEVGLLLASVAVVGAAYLVHDLAAGRAARFWSPGTVTLSKDEVLLDFPGILERPVVVDGGWVALPPGDRATGGVVQMILAPTVNNLIIGFSKDVLFPVKPGVRPMTTWFLPFEERVANGAKPVRNLAVRLRRRDLVRLRVFQNKVRAG